MQVLCVFKPPPFSLCGPVCRLQAELAAAAVTGASVPITLPDTGAELQVAVGQEWVEVGAAGGVGVAKTYFVKWVQDESGALAVLEVVPAVRQLQQHQPVLSLSGSGAVAPVAC